jgi:hypothetical protein
MPTTWFFDGSGTGSECDVLVLSGVGASDSLWADFNADWAKGLEQLGLQEWHSTKYFKNPDGSRGRRGPVEILNVIGKQVTKRINYASFAIRKSDALSVRAEYPEIVPSDSLILVSMCFNCLGAAEEDSHEPDRIRILFDRSEPFINQLKQPWQTARKSLRRQGKHGWPRQVREIEPASSREYPGMQLADLVSWTIRCRYEYGDRMIDPKIAMLMFCMMPNLRGGFLDAEVIRALYVKKDHPELRHSYSFE